MYKFALSKNLSKATFFICIEVVVLRPFANALFVVVGGCLEPAPLVFPVVVEEFASVIVVAMLLAGFNVTVWDAQVADSPVFVRFGAGNPQSVVLKLFVRVASTCTICIIYKIIAAK